MENYPAIRSDSMSRILLILRTAIEKKPQLNAGSVIGHENSLVNRYCEPITPTKPKKIKTERSPRPIFPYGFLPTVYAIAAMMERTPSTRKIKNDLSS